MQRLSKVLSTARTSKMALSELSALSTLYADGSLEGTSSPSRSASAALNAKISLVRTDITSLQTDAIVNAANTSLLGGGGVDGAIHRAAGRQLLAECRTLNGCNTGSAKITDAYNLPCRKVIHAVGPVYSSARKDESARLLKGCYQTSLDLLSQNGLASIAFSALSTGVYGYPSKDAAVVAVAAVRDWLDADQQRAAKVDRIVFCSFMEKDERAYEKVVPDFFPPVDEETST